MVDVYVEMPLLQDNKEGACTKVRFFIVVKALNCLWQKGGISGIFESLTKSIYKLYVAFLD